MTVHVAEMDCRADPLDVRHARAFVAANLNAWGLTELVESAELLTSEVVTNAIIRSPNPVRLVVESRVSAVVVEVKDSAGPAQVVMEGEVAAEADHGHGLVLVDALSDRWGSWKEDDGTVVWFALVAA